MSTDSSDRPVPPPAAPPRRRLLTRRRVLLGAGGLVGSAVAGALGYDQRLRFGRDAEATIADHRVAAAAGTPPMVVARGVDPARNVRAALERLGGLRQFLTPADVVLIKPNIGWQRTPEQGANTHPAVVAELVRACRDTGARRVIVSDCPVRRSRGAFERSGILEAALKAGAEVVIPEDSRLLKVRVSERLGVWDVLEPFVQATKIINVPVAKHHSLIGTSAGMKNWIGITNMLRVKLHNDLQRSIAELAALMRPTLTVLDASRVLMENGPSGGNLDDVKATHSIVAGLDPVAIDAWACELFGVSGDALPEFLALAEGLGLGRRDYRALRPVEVLAG